MRYPYLSEELDYSGGRRDWSEISSAEKYFPEVNDCAVHAPGEGRNRGLLIAAIAKSIAKYVPDKVERWGENALQKQYQ